MLERIVINPEVMVEKRVIKGIRNCILNISIKRYPYHFGLLSLIISLNSFSSTGIEGQLSGWGIVVDNSQTNSSSVGLRYIPGIFWGVIVNNESTLDLEFSGNIFTSFSLNHFDQFAENAELKPYRWWIRYATPHTESRLGLQKINFGPAKLLRTLMWFDRLDPNDPIQFTDGVYGLRLRYDFQNNASVWLWGLYGNDNPKGWEMFATKEKTPEVGGRIQYPLGNAEIAFTAHHRSVQQEGIAENRIALDGFWDVGVGLWFESAIVHADLNGDTLDYQSFLTLGMDYTFPAGNGLHVLGEHLLLTVGDAPFDQDTKTELSGILISYPMGIMDQLSFFNFYNWDLDLPFHYLSWMRTYDRWMIHLSGFWSSEEKPSAEVNQSMANFSKKGVQLMIIFNH